MRFCFWNINRKDLSKHLRDLLDENGTDILFLAECPLSPSYLLSELNKKSVDFFFCPNVVCEKLLIFTRFRETLLPLLQESPRISARSFFYPSIGKDITLIALHYQSKINWTDEDQAAQSMELKLFIDSVEEQVNHKRTIIFGDFNMHPFDDGLVQTTGLHSTMDRNIAKQLTRTVSGKDYDYFYNPMWSFLGDLGKGKVSGTIYYSPAKPINYHWNIFDQVLVRPELIDNFDVDYLDIITTIGSKSLLTSKGLVKKNIFSDHLPIKFSLI